LLPEDLGHLRLDDASHEIGCAPRRERHDHPDRTRRILLGGSSERSKKQARPGHFAHYSYHLFFLFGNCDTRQAAMIAIPSEETAPWCEGGVTAGVPPTGPRSRHGWAFSPAAASAHSSPRSPG